MSKVFLHIGTNKTGTSAIQYCLSHDREQLKKQGLLYPKTGWLEQSHAHYHLSEALGFPTAGLPQLSYKSTAENQSRLLAMRASLDDETLNNNAFTIIFSSEMFGRIIDLSLVREFFSHDEVRFVVYLRRHDFWYPALYSQSLKSRVMVNHPPSNPVGIKKFIESQENNPRGCARYRKFLDHWAAAFGRENIIVRPYESCQIGSDILVDFLQTIATDIGVDPLQLTQRITPRSTRINRSLSPKGIRLMEIFQSTRVQPDVRERLVRHALSFLTTDASISILSPAQRIELIEKNAEDYAYIAREYMGREDGRLFYDPLPEPNKDWKPPAQFGPRVLVEETVNALSNQPAPATPKQQPLLQFARRALKCLTNRRNVKK